MFGPREVLLTSDQPVVKQFPNGRRIGPIGMSVEKDDGQMAQERRWSRLGGTTRRRGNPWCATAD
jgi:phospholipid/cholesterol/gamma-HCH transport system ATP-binding protein